MDSGEDDLVEPLVESKREMEQYAQSCFFIIFANHNKDHWEHGKFLLPFP